MELFLTEWSRSYFVLALAYFFLFRAASEIQKSLNVPLDDMTALVKLLSLRFHQRHYLVILVKKHLTAMYGDDLATLSKEKLKERLKLCEEVSSAEYIL